MRFTLGLFMGLVLGAIVSMLVLVKVIGKTIAVALKEIGVTPVRSNDKGGGQYGGLE